MPLHAALLGEKSGSVRLGSMIDYVNPQKILRYCYFRITLSWFHRGLWKCFADGMACHPFLQSQSPHWVVRVHHFRFFATTVFLPSFLFKRIAGFFQQVSCVSVRWPSVSAERTSMIPQHSFYRRIGMRNSPKVGYNQVGPKTVTVLPTLVVNFSNLYRVVCLFVWLFVYDCASSSCLRFSP